MIYIYISRNEIFLRKKTVPKIKYENKFSDSCHVSSKN